jgi:hypothetical protein
MADEHSAITFNLAYTHGDTPTYFDIARKEFGRDLWPVVDKATRAEVEAILKRITHRDFQTVVPRFSDNIGMKRARME